MTNTNSQRFEQRINAPRSCVYQALIDPDAIVAWKVPSGMNLQVHTFDAREGGTFRISLIYEDQTREGKSSAHTDTYHGYFAELVPNERVVEVNEFETADPTLTGTMTVSYTLLESNGGTELVAVHEGLPAGVAPADNELGWQMALAKLTALVEQT